MFVLTPQLCLSWDAGLFTRLMEFDIISIFNFHTLIFRSCSSHSGAEAVALPLSSSSVSASSSVLWTVTECVPLVCLASSGGEWRAAGLLCSPPPHAASASTFSHIKPSREEVAVSPSSGGAVCGGGTKAQCCPKSRSPACHILSYTSGLLLSGGNRNARCV